MGQLPHTFAIPLLRPGCGRNKALCPAGIGNTRIIYNALYYKVHVIFHSLRFF